MMINDRTKYGSASEWLSALMQDDLWLSQLKRLEASVACDNSALRDEALTWIGKGESLCFWTIYHQVEPVVNEVWDLAELSLPKLKMQTIGMLSIEWLERHDTSSPRMKASEPSSDVVNQLKPIFYGSEEEAKAFLTSIQGMKSKQITEKVNMLVKENKISEFSKHRDLWKFLYDNGYYDKTESNWNQQVK